jgi:hypothetical protein
MGKKKTVRQQVEEQFQEWTDSVQGLSVSDLDSMILRYAKYREEIKDAKEKDETLQKTKELIKELSAPYRESLKANELKTKYLITLLGEKGGETSGKV